MHHHLFIRTGWLVLLAGLLVIAPRTSAAQVIGDCPRSEGEAYLDVNDVRARILNNGALFFRGIPYSYEVPKDSGIQAIFASNLWIGGRVGGEVRTAGTLFGEWEFWPGPLDEGGNPPADCTRTTVCRRSRTPI